MNATRTLPARHTSSAIATNNTPICGIGRPQTSAESPAAFDKELAQCHGFLVVLSFPRELISTKLYESSCGTESALLLVSQKALWLIAQLHGKDLASQSTGFTCTPPTQTSQCKCGPVERPVSPPRPTTCPV